MIQLGGEGFQINDFQRQSSMSVCLEEYYENILVLDAYLRNDFIAALWLM